MKKRFVGFVVVMLILLSAMIGCGTTEPVVLISGIDGYGDAVIDSAKKEVSVTVAGEVTELNLSAVKVDGDVIFKAYADAARKVQITEKFTMEVGENVFYLVIGLKDKPEFSELWTFKITRAETAHLESVELVSFRTSYAFGEAYVNDGDGANGKLKLTFSDGAISYAPVTAAMLRGFDTSRVGKVTVIIEYSKEYSFTKEIIVTSSAEFVKPAETVIDSAEFEKVVVSFMAIAEHGALDDTLEHNAASHYIGSTRSPDIAQYCDVPRRLFEKSGITLEELKQVKPHLVEIGDIVSRITSQMGMPFADISGDVKDIFSSVNAILGIIPSEKMGVLWTYMDNTFGLHDDYLDEALALATQKGLTEVVKKYTEYKAVGANITISEEQFAANFELMSELKVKLSVFTSGEADNIGNILGVVDKISKCKSFADFKKIPQGEVMSAVRAASQFVDLSFNNDIFNAILITCIEKKNAFDILGILEVISKSSEYDILFDKSDAICNLLDIITYDDIIDFVDNFMKNKNDSNTLQLVARVAKVVKRFDDTYSSEQVAQLHELIENIVVKFAQKKINKTIPEIHEFALQVAAYGDYADWTNSENDAVKNFIKGVEVTNVYSVISSLKNDFYAFDNVAKGATIEELVAWLNTRYDFSKSGERGSTVFEVTADNIFGYSPTSCGAQEITIKKDNVEGKVEIYLFDDSYKKMVTPRYIAGTPFSLNFPDGFMTSIVHVDKEGHVLNANRAWLELNNYLNSGENRKQIIDITPKTVTSVCGVDLNSPGLQRGFLKVCDAYFGDIYYLVNIYVRGEEPILTNISVRDSYFLNSAMPHDRMSFNSLLLKIDDTPAVFRGELFIEYDYGTTGEVRSIDETMLSGFDGTKIGQQTVTITYGGQSITVKVDVVTLESLLAETEIESVEMPTRYIVSDTASNILDTANIKMTISGAKFARHMKINRVEINNFKTTLTYAEFKEIFGEDLTYSGFESAKVGKQTVTFSIFNMSYDVEVDVLSMAEASIVTNASVEIRNEYNKAIVKEDSNIADYIYVTAEFGGGVARQTLKLSEMNALLVRLGQPEFSVVESDFTLGFNNVSLTNTALDFAIEGKFEYINADKASWYVIKGVECSTGNMQYYVYDDNSLSKFDLKLRVTYETYYGEPLEQQIMTLFDFVKNGNARYESVDFNKSGKYYDAKLVYHDQNGSDISLDLPIIAVLQKSEIEKETGIEVDTWRTIKDAYLIGEEIANGDFCLGVDYGYGYGYGLISYDKNTMTVTGFDNTVTGKQTITIGYKGLTTNHYIRVITAQEAESITGILRIEGIYEYLPANVTIDNLDLTAYVEVGYGYGEGKKIKLDSSNIALEPKGTYRIKLTVTIEGISEEFEYRVAPLTDAELKWVSYGDFCVSDFLIKDLQATEILIDGFTEPYGRVALKVSIDKLDFTDVNNVKVDLFGEKVALVNASIYEFTAINSVYTEANNEYSKFYQNMKITHFYIDAKFEASGYQYQTIKLPISELKGINLATIGEQTASITFAGKTFTKTITVYPVLEIKIQPSTDEFYFIQGDTRKNVRATIKVSENETINMSLPMSAISGLDINKVGSQAVTVSLYGNSYNTTIMVYAIKSIETLSVSMRGRNIGNRFFASANLDDCSIQVNCAIEGLDITVDFNVDRKAISGLDLRTAGEQTITIDIFGKKLPIKTYVVADGQYKLTTKRDFDYLIVGEPPESQIGYSYTVVENGYAYPQYIEVYYADMIGLDINTVGEQDIKVLVNGIEMPTKIKVCGYDRILEINNKNNQWIFTKNNSYGDAIIVFNMKCGDFTARHGVTVAKSLLNIIWTNVGEQEITFSFLGVSYTHKIAIYDYSSVNNIRVIINNNYEIEFIKNMDTSVISSYIIDCDVSYTSENGGDSRSVQFSLTPDKITGLDVTKVGKQEITVDVFGTKLPYTITVYDYESVNSIALLGGQAPAYESELYFIKNMDMTDITYIKVRCNLVSGTNTRESFVYLPIGKLSGLNLAQAGAQTVSVDLFGTSLSCNITAHEIESVSIEKWIDKDGKEFYFNKQQFHIENVVKYVVLAKLRGEGNLYERIVITADKVQGLTAKPKEGDEITIEVFGEQFKSTIHFN